MNTILQGKLFPQSVVPHRDNVLAMGPLSKQPGSTPYRIVLIERDDKLIVYAQGFKENENGTLDFGKTSFSQGDYYGPDELVKATQRFAERTAKHAEYLQSLYRVDEPVTV